MAGVFRVVSLQSHQKGFLFFLLRPLLARGRMAFELERDGASAKSGFGRFRHLDSPAEGRWALQKLESDRNG